MKRRSDLAASGLAASGAPAPRTFLYSAQFAGDWTERCLAALRSHRTARGAAPLVLLPDDIQLEEYEPLFPVLCGESADAELGRLLASGCADRARLVFVDLAPDALPGDDLFIPLLRDGLRRWPSALTLVVAAPEPVPFPAGLFDRHLSLPGA